MKKKTIAVTVCIPFLVSACGISIDKVRMGTTSYAEVEEATEQEQIHQTTDLVGITSVDDDTNRAAIYNRGVKSRHRTNPSESFSETIKAMYNNLNTMGKSWVPASKPKKKAVKKPNGS